MSWFRSWFDSPYYHILYQHRDENEAEFFLNNLLQYLKPSPGTSMLDIGCGKGRHSVYLNEKGYVVTGIDLSEKSIEHCLQYENETLSFFVHDMRKLFRVNNYDYIFNLFTSFGYFDTKDENLAVLKNACLALRKNGIFIIDFMNISYIEKHLIKEETITVDHIPFQIKRNIINGFLLKQINFNAEGREFEYIEKVAALDMESLTGMVTAAGMDIKNIFGDYKLNGFTPDSERLIILSTKCDN